MSTSLTIRDETLGGSVREWGLAVAGEPMSVGDLIHNRVLHEVEIHNARPDRPFQGLVQPSEDERVLNDARTGRSRTRGRRVDAGAQISAALQAFSAGRMLVIVNDRQVDNLDEQIDVTAETTVTFIRLALLVGG